MNTTNPIGTFNQFQSVPIWIASTKLKNNGRKDIRELSAKSASRSETEIFILDDTFRTLRDTHNFIVDVGCEIHNGTGFYRCI